MNDIELQKLIDFQNNYYKNKIILEPIFNRPLFFGFLFRNFLFKKEIEIIYNSNCISFYDKDENSLAINYIKPHLVFEFFKYGDLYLQIDFNLNKSISESYFDHYNNGIFDINLYEECLYFSLNAFIYEIKKAMKND